MKVINTFLILVFLLSVVCADPQITGIQKPTIITYATSTDFNVLFDAEGQTGTMNFWVDGSITEQRLFSSGTTLLKFSKTFTTLGEKTITFSITGLSGADSNLENNSMDRDINVLKGVDFQITGLATEPTTILPGQNTVFKIFLKNIGDLAYVGEIPIDLFFDGNTMGQTTTLDLDVNETREISFEYVIPDSFTGSSSVLAQVNKTNAIREFDYTNNTRLLELDEASGTNLKINTVSTSGDIYVGQLKEFTANIENNGGETASGVKIYIYKTVISNGTKIGEYTINTLSGHTSQEIKFSQFFGSVGEDKIILFIDPLNTVTEFNESDNDFTLAINVLDSNIVMDMGTYLSTLETFENELNTCQDELKASRLERDVALDNVAMLTTERNNCTSNLNVCNENNTSFFVNALDNIRSTTESDVNATETYYFNELREKDEEMSSVKAEANKKVLEAEKYSVYGYALAAFIIIINIGSFVFKLQKGRLTRLGGDA